MKIGMFDHGPQVTVDSLTADDAFGGGENFDELYVRVWGLPDPDPATRYVMRLADNFVNGIGADVLVETVSGEFVPAPCAPLGAPAASSPAPAPGATPHAPASPAAPSSPAPTGRAPAAPAARPGAAPAAPAPSPQRRGRR
jgi:hypothetical protein